MTSKSEQAMAEIEQRIARTRAELGLTLDATATELAPRRLVEQGVDMITDFLSANRPDGISFGAALRADPVPLALIGLGVAWLVAESIGLVGGVKPGEHSAPPGEGPAPTQRIGDHASPVLNDAETGGGGWMQRAAGVAQGAVRSIVTDGGAALGRAGDYLGGALPGGDSVQRRGWLRGIERNPLLLGATGMAAGAVVALLLPTTRREQEIVGEARADLWEKAEEFGHRAAEGVRSLAGSSARPTSDG